MLMRLLVLIGRGGIQRPRDLAAELGTTPALVEGMLADLERMGYLASVPDQCGPSACHGCGQACAGPLGMIVRGGKMWALTAKGARLLESAGED
jgi:hypothetical protein